MKVAHFGVFAPYASGQYGTIKDLISAERSFGIEAGFVDFGFGGKPYNRVGLIDDHIETVPIPWASNADIIMRHSAVPQQVEKLGIPVLTVLHGRPESSSILELYGKLFAITEILKAKEKPNHAGFLTLWEEFISQWSAILGGEKVSYVPSPVNLSDYVDVKRNYTFNGKGGNPNIVIADVWTGRQDTTPFNAIMAASVFKEKYAPDAKIHVYALPNKGSLKFLHGLKKNGVLGETRARVEGLKHVFGSADMLITPHVIATRLIREALAVGLPFVAGQGCRYTKYHASTRNIELFAKEMKRCWDGDEAESNIDLREKKKIELGIDNVGKHLKSLFEKVKQKSIQVTSGDKLKLALVYNRHDHKLQDTSYSWIYKGMFNALVDRFDVVHINDDCKAASIDADAILFYDMHSSHHIKIDGVKDHPATKMEYFIDLQQQELKGVYKQFNMPVHKLGPQQRVDRFLERGIDYLISPYLEATKLELIDMLDDAIPIWHFPPAPVLTGKPKPLKDRKLEVLGNGISHGWVDAYEFRAWTFKQPYVSFVPHWIEEKGTPSGQKYMDFLSNYAGAIGANKYAACPKYFEIPMAGCVLFAEYLEEFEKLGFKDYEHCIYINKDNFEERVKAFLSKPEEYQGIADAGRKLVEENYTAKHFADFIYNHLTKEVKA